MTVKRCDMCFQDKPALTGIIPNCPAQVCKACAYKISTVTGFLIYHGVGLQYKLPEAGIDERDFHPPKPKKNGEKKES